MIEIWNLILLFTVSILWGITNPLLKKTSNGIENIKAGNLVSQFFAEIWFLASKLSYAAPFLLNQLGGILFVYSLGVLDLSIVVPLTNSLSFIITIITGYLLGEETITQSVWIGSALICAGIGLCIVDNTLQQ